MQGWSAIFKREFAAYFATPVALVFSIVFLSLASAFTFYLGDFFILEEVESLCTRVVVIARGKMVADGTPHELKARSRYANAVILSIARADRVKIEAALKQLPNVAGVEGCLVK